MTLNTRKRSLGTFRRQITMMKSDRQRLSLCLVTAFFLVSGAALLLDLLLDERHAGIQYVGEGGGPRAQEGDYSWETPPPLPLLSRNLRLYATNSGMDGDKFKDRILARQVEMQQLIRNISASMSRNPMVQQIQASRAQFKYKVEPGAGSGLWVDPSLKKHTGRDASWQPVNGTRHKFFVYSAYYDNREKPLVRMIAATKTKKSDKVWCKLYYAGRQPVLVQAGISTIRENWNLQYSAVFVTCDLMDRTSKTFMSAPQSVSVVAKLNLPASNQLPVHFSTSGIRPPKEPSIGVCVKPLHFHYNKTLELLQFIELNLILGVSKFTLYNDTVGPEVDCLLRHYQEQGIVQVLPWRLDMDSQKEIRTEGLFAALNDCLYRNMNSFKYLMLIDLDELIIPYKNATLLELVADLGSRTLLQAGKPLAPSQVGSYSFQNAFFYLQWPDDPGAASEPPLPAILKTRRRQKLHPPKQRSKYICLPGAVKEAGNHFIWEFHRGKTLNVPPSFGLLHHYRVCEFGGDDCVNNEHVEDLRVPSTYGAALLARVTARVQDSGCRLPSLDRH